MALLVAYSQEYGALIDAEMAYDLYWSGTIKDKSAFSCPSDHCKGKVTCANLDKAEQDLLQTPHFRSYRHDDSCDLNNSSESTKETNKTVTEFVEQRPQGMLKKQQANRNEKQASLNSTADKRNYQPSFYTVRSLVTKFIQYRQADELEQHYIGISGQQLSYKQLFKGVYNQPLHRLPEHKTVYWGVAYVDKLKKSGDYRIKFVEAFNSEDKTINPSFFIDHTELDEYAIKPLLQTRLEKVIAEKDKRAFVFIYSEPPKLAKSGEYINFNVDSLDHIEIRYLDLFKQLVKK
ncbi:hypothetical protein N8878_06220 [Psychromonas sp.]|nr:hypothetical protein [Psychromonas sp.]